MIIVWPPTTFIPTSNISVHYSWWVMVLPERLITINWTLREENSTHLVVNSSWNILQPPSVISFKYISKWTQLIITEGFIFLLSPPPTSVLFVRNTPQLPPTSSLFTSKIAARTSSEAANIAWWRRWRRTEIDKMKLEQANPNILRKYIILSENLRLCLGGVCKRLRHLLPVECNLLFSFMLAINRRIKIICTSSEASSRQSDGVIKY